jgi:hypothetical protein
LLNGRDDCGTVLIVAVNTMAKKASDDMIIKALALRDWTISRRCERPDL